MNHRNLQISAVPSKPHRRARRRMVALTRFH
jgi:hypothetical protein